MRRLETAIFLIVIIGTISAGIYTLSLIPSQSEIQRIISK